MDIFHKYFKLFDVYNYLDTVETRRSDEMYLVDYDVVSSDDTENQRRHLPSISVEGRNFLRTDLSQYTTALSRRNNNTVSKVEKLVRDQQNEITLLSARIENLKKQIDQQKRYYMKRNQRVNKNKRFVFDIETASLDAKTQTRLDTSDATTSPIPCQTSHKECEAQQRTNHVVLADKSCSTFETCMNTSQVKVVRTEVVNQVTKAANDEEAFAEIERLHNKTQDLYSRLSIMLSQLHCNNGSSSSLKSDATNNMMSGAVNNMKPISVTGQEGQGSSGNIEIETDSTSEFDTSVLTLTTAVYKMQNKLTSNIKTSSENTKTKTTDAINYTRNNCHIHEGPKQPTQHTHQQNQRRSQGNPRSSIIRPQNISTHNCSRQAIDRVRIHASEGTRNSELSSIHTVAGKTVPCA